MPRAKGPGKSSSFNSRWERAPIQPGRQVQSTGRWQVYEIRVGFEFYLCHLLFVQDYDIKDKKGFVKTGIKCFDMWARIA